MTSDLAKTTPDAPQPSAIQADLAATLPALAILRAQLQETAAQVEGAVTEVCRSFSGMVSRARESVAQANRCLSQSSAQDEQAASRALLAVAHRMVERTENASQRTLQTIEKMSRVETEMQHIGESLHDVDEIATALRLLGLNATIEAARAGVHGRTFGVVASETTSLADQAARLNKSIRQTVQTTHRSVDSTAQDMRAMAEALTRDSQSNHQEVTRSIDSMRAFEEQLRGSVQQAAQAGESLAQDIGRAVVAMQFQDSVNQRIAHVVETLQEIEQRLAGHANPAQGGRNAQGSQHDCAGDLLRRYTMQSERTVHAAKTGAAPIQAAPVQAGSLSDSVVLF